MIQFNGNKIELGTFPDGTLLMKLAVMGDQIEIQWYYENDAELFALICAAKHLRRINSNVSLSLFLPYIPHGRMDRVYETSDVFTLKYFAEIINSLAFDKVTVLDPHSNVSAALIDNIHILSPIPYIQQAMKLIQDIEGETPLLYYPDSNAAKKYSEALAHPYCYGNKKRNWSDGKIIGLEVMDNSNDIANRCFLMIDDIISYGGSMYYSASALKGLGANNIYAFASHAENSVLDGRLIQSGLINRLFTTNSLYTGQHDLIHVSKLQ
jgi:ribose-phosphate pyrophosphokinase